MESIGNNLGRDHKAGLLGWLGFASRGADHHHNDVIDTHRGAQSAERLLMDHISSFLLENGLAITGANLETAHGICAGLNPGLGRKIDRRRESGQPINQAWLDLQLAEISGESDASLEEFARKLELGLTEFARSTQDAHKATRQYGDALEGHVGQLETAPDPGEIIGELAQYARAMLDRSRRVEAELRDSERQAQRLQRNLERARHDADFDYLTGLPNRRAFEKVLEEEMSSARIRNENLAVGFCDIDHFKIVNDTHGHDAGDRILCVVAETLNRVSGDMCHVARHGGEEFVLLFRGATTDDAFDRLDSARRQLAARKLVNRRTEQPFGQITFSGGVADVFAYDTARAALSAADGALYLAKEGGRNQIKLAAGKA